MGALGGKVLATGVRVCLCVFAFDQVCVHLCGCLHVYCSQYLSPLSVYPDAAGERASLHRQQSLPHRPTIPMVARIADQNTSGTPAMTEREASRLDKFRQVLAGPNTDLGMFLDINYRSKIRRL